MNRIEQLEATVAKLEARVRGLEARLGIRPTAPTLAGADRSKVPVNHIAYERALDATVHGDRKALSEYCRFYRVPT